MFKKIVFLVVFAMTFFVGGCGSNEVPDVTEQSVKELSIETLIRGVHVKKENANEAADDVEKMVTAETVGRFAGADRQFDLYRDELENRYHEIADRALEMAGTDLCYDSYMNMCGILAVRRYKLGEALYKKGYENPESLMTNASDVAAFARNFREDRLWKNGERPFIYQ